MLDEINVKKGLFQHGNTKQATEKVHPNAYPNTAAKSTDPRPRLQRSVEKRMIGRQETIEPIGRVTFITIHAFSPSFGRLKGVFHRFWQLFCVCVCSCWILRSQMVLGIFRSDSRSKQNRQPVRTGGPFGEMEIEFRLENVT